MKQKLSQGIILKLAIGLVSLCSLRTLIGILAKVYGGNITFVSEEGKGSVFTIHLPLKEVSLTLLQGFGDSAAAPLSCP